MVISLLLLNYYFIIIDFRFFWNNVRFFERFKMLDFRNILSL